jgi:hypothetical protein
MISRKEWKPLPIYIEEMKQPSVIKRLMIRSKHIFEEIQEKEMQDINLQGEYYSQLKQTQAHEESSSKERKAVQE